MQNEISALAAGSEKDRDYSLECQDTICGRMFVVLGKVLNGQETQSKNTMYEMTKQIVVANTNGWQTRLRDLANLATTSLVESSSIAGSASDARLTTEPKALGGESVRYVSCSFKYQFNVGDKASSP